MKDPLKADEFVILCVDDDVCNLLYMKMLIRNYNYSTLQANNGKEAVEICREHPELGLVLMDIRMPIMDGIEATRIIKQFRNELPIIAVTAFCMDDERVKILEAGFSDFIPKPVGKEILSEKIVRYGKLMG